MHNKKEPVIKNKNIINYPSRTLDPPISLIDLAKEIERSEEIIKININGKLDLILKEINRLKEEAKKIIEQTYKDLELHKVKCNFQKIPGEIIYLYKKTNEEFYFSRLSFSDWKNNPPDEFIDAYIYKSDRTFEKIKI
ncbi:MAG: DUF2452 domain-containing protein [Spirochaetes bacterium]|nr:DUF2452 domain-containing protein [Spirochaetota bacterium]